ncbi:MAG TPA: hypothetical protein VMC62_11385 [Longilinea sp.]|nr:hypothetical protein [Longilinea sp.]
MGRANIYGSHSPEPGKPREVHAIWRGIGFAFIFLLPVLSYVGALVLLQSNTENNWFPIPSDWLVNFGNDPMLLVKVVLALVIMFILYAVFMLITFTLYRFFAPPRYGPTDVPPVKVRKIKRT